MMKSLSTLVLLLFCAAAWATEPFTVMSFNLRGDFDGGVATDKPTGWLSNSGDHRRELVLRLASEADPDLLGVQEAYRNQVREIGAALSGHAFVGVGRDDGAARGEHSCLYYRKDRFKLVKSGTFWLSNTPDKPSTYPGAACPRVATWAVLSDKESDGRELLVVNTHWDHVSAEARRYSAELIRQRLAELAGDRQAIVMGDLNVSEENEPIATLLGDGPQRLVDSFREVQPQRGKNERTYHDFKGGEQGSRIDYIVHTDGLRATDAEIVRTEYEGRYPSDHYPVTATIEWK